MKKTILLLILALGWLAGLLYGAAADESKPAPQRNITFIATSDVHYDAFENEDRNDRVRDTIQRMNAITSESWPASLGGGAIQKPRGVVALGDVIDDGDRIFEGKKQTAPQYAFFAADFGLDGTDGKLKYPVYEGWGNHDGPPAGKERNGFSFQAELKKRNALRKEKGWLTGLSENGLHYSWDWDDVHFIQLNIYPADTQNPNVKYSAEWHNPQGSLTFMKEDLAKRVGSSGRPVALMSHCGFDTNWWIAEDWKAAYEAAKPYNVILYLYGHTGTGVSEWAPAGESQKWATINTGQAENGFFVVQIENNSMRYAYCVKKWIIEKTPGAPDKKRWEGIWEWKWPKKVELKPAAATP
ncbi:MAG: metallophosphoesterase [Candidatus Sumerlaeota bacterium]|nr:metallophosphoesterase [Candidatus Sumerlaeota bacterium]